MITQHFKNKATAIAMMMVVVVPPKFVVDHDLEGNDDIKTTKYKNMKNNWLLITSLFYLFNAFGDSDCYDYNLSPN